MARVPYVVALNRSSGDDHALVDQVRTRLDIPGDVAILPCDATDKESVKSVLLALLYASSTRSRRSPCASEHS
jgi:signal recognition particle receptor subunit beta